MDIVTVLKADHRKVDELFSQIEGTSDRALKTKERLFVQLKTELTIHMTAEEKFLYPRMMDLPELRAQSFEAHEEHRLVKQLLGEVSELACGSEQWLAKLKITKDLVEHHVREEEEEIFKGLKAFLDKSELNQMGAAVAAFKMNLQAPSNGKQQAISPLG